MRPERINLKFHQTAPCKTLNHLVYQLGCGGNDNDSMCIEKYKNLPFNSFIGILQKLLKCQTKI